MYYTKTRVHRIIELFLNAACDGDSVDEVSIDEESMSPLETGSPVDDDLYNF